MIVLDISAGSARPHVIQKFVLDGKLYQLRLDWSQREEKWYMSLYDSADQLLQGRVKVVADFPLTRNCNSDGRPLGALFAIDTSGQGLDPHLRDFETGRVQFWYREASEFE